MRIKTIILLLTIIVFNNSSAVRANDDLILGLSLGPDYLYRFGNYQQTLYHTDDMILRAQIDFVPPRLFEPVKVVSQLYSFDFQVTTTTTTEYDGQKAWVHWLIEPYNPGWHLWTVKFVNAVGATQQLTFYVERE